MSKIDDGLVEVFQEMLSISDGTVVLGATYNETPGWDSLMHLNIVAAIEERFGIMLETEQVLDMSSFDKAREIVKANGVED